MSVWFDKGMEDMIRKFVASGKKTVNGAGTGTYDHTEQPQREKKIRQPKGTPASRTLISLLITVVFAGLYFYFALPAINPRSREFYVFLVLVGVCFCLCRVLMEGAGAGSGAEFTGFVKKSLKFPLGFMGILALVLVIGSLSGWVVFRAKAYSKLITIETGDFATDVSEIDWNQIPLLDSNSANNLANRKLGELSDLVSQFEVDEASAQINYNGRPVRVNYLNYSDVFKWWNNRTEGIPAYIMIDMRTQDVDVVRLESGIKYSPSEYFNRNLMRHLRFQYPTLMFDDVNFEVNDDGTPYWVASVMTRKIGLFGGTDIKGAVLVNAVTGESEYYEVGNIPSWVDRVYSSNLIINQYDNYGEYHNGFWNSIFGQKDCSITTDGYNYIAQNDDVWLYTGITSVTGDLGNIGFILVNQRTKEAHYYSCAGAEEYSAMNSAQGAVQQYNYISTFPLLLNISDQPTYFMALKDTAGLVKMYALVNVQQYQIVAIGSTVAECQRNYHELMVTNGIVEETGDDAYFGDAESLSGRIAEIRSAEIDGNTVFYIRLEEADVYYTISAQKDPKAVLLNVGDTISFTYYPEDEILLEIEQIAYDF